MKSSILATLIYSDLFDYPLTSSELDKWEIKALRLCSGQNKVRELWREKEGYFFLAGREQIVEIRKERKKWSKVKQALAQKTAEKLAPIPGIKMIGLTGALAMNNAKEEDDIDFLVITSRNSLWLTRLVIFSICPFWKIIKRKPGDKNFKDKICLNLFLDEDNLKVGPENLFLAHEVCQVKPLVNKDETYEKFLWANQWARKYLPKALKVKELKSKRAGVNKHFLALLPSRALTLFNKIAFMIQYRYMKPRMTTEKISLTQAFFHPGNLGERILRKYERRLHEQGINFS